MRSKQAHPLAGTPYSRSGPGQCFAGRPPQIKLALGDNDVRANHHRILLQLLWQHQVLSRADLARLSGLSRPSVSALIAEQISFDLIREFGTGKSQGGRRPVLLRFHEDAANLLGLALEAEHVSVLVCNLRGDIIEWQRLACPIAREPAESLEYIQELVTRARERAELRQSRILGLGLGIPCPLYQNGLGIQTLHPSTFPRWEGIDLATLLSLRHKIPVFVENDANICALAEAWWPEPRLTSNIVYLKLSGGLGAGVLIRSEILRGSHGLAGELGTTLRLGTNGPEAISCRLSQTLEQLGVLGADRSVSERGLIMQELAAEGPLETRQLIESFLQELARLIVNTLVSFDPDRVILGDLAGELGPRLTARLRKLVGEALVWPEQLSVPLDISRFAAKQTAMGAATLVLKQALQDFRYFSAMRQSPEPYARIRE